MYSIRKTACLLSLVTALFGCGGKDFYANADIGCDCGPRTSGAIVNPRISTTCGSDVTVGLPMQVIAHNLIASTGGSI